VVDKKEHREYEDVLIEQRKRVRMRKNIILEMEMSMNG
jgi:hypothetical protein